MSLSRKLIVLVLTTKIKETEHHIHPNTKDKQKTALAIKTNYILVRYAFYDPRPGNGAGHILTQPFSNEHGPNTSMHLSISVRFVGVGGV